MATLGIAVRAPDARTPRAHELEASTAWIRCDTLSAVTMQIWVDADACPQVIKEILFRAAERAKVLTTLVSNMPLLRTPASSFIRTIRVAKGFDVADQRIALELRP